MNNNLAKNIRALRETHGESLEKLGEYLHVSKSAVSQYENGRREISNDMLNAISKHYMVPVEMLLHGDLSEIGRINANKNTFWENIDIVFPIIYTDTAMNSAHFKRAYRANVEFYDELKRGSLKKINELFLAMTEYEEAFDEKWSCTEAAVNFVASWSLLLMMAKCTPVVYQNKPAVLMRMAEADSRIREIVDGVDSSLEEDSEKATEFFETPEMMAKVFKMFRVIKESEQWSDLSYYYMALQYIYNLKDNDMEWETNQMIGSEMLNSYAGFGNVYAEQFLQLSIVSLGLS